MSIGTSEGPKLPLDTFASRRRSSGLTPVKIVHHLVLCVAYWAPLTRPRTVKSSTRCWPTANLGCTFPDCQEYPERTSG